MIAQQCYASEEPGTGPTTCSPPGGLVGAGATGAGATGAGATGDLGIEKKQELEQSQSRRQNNIKSRSKRRNRKKVLFRNRRRKNPTQLTKNPRMKSRGRTAPPW